MQSRNLLIAAVLLAALSGAVWYAKKHPQPAPSSTASAATPKLADVPADQVQSLDLKKKDGSEIKLQREKGKWAITSPETLAADQDAVSSMASSLNPVTADNVVEDKASDLGKYGLTAPTLTLTVHEKNGKSDQIEFGDDVPAGSLVYARLGNGSKVYALASSVKSSFDKGVNDLRDKRLLTFDANQLTRVDLSGKRDLEFGKNNSNEWRILKPEPARADNFQVEELVRKLGDAKMDLSASTDDAKKAAPGFASGQPVTTVKVADSSGTESLEVRKNKDDYYGKSSVVPGVFKLSSDLGKELEKSPDDFRNKKVFDFGFSDPTRLEVQGPSGDKTYMRAGTDWKLNGTTIDPGSIQSFIDKIRDAAAAKFVTTGFTSPVLTVGVTSDNGKRVEKVEFSKAGDEYIARRGNDSTLYQMDAKSVNDIVEASKSIKPSAPAGKK